MSALRRGVAAASGTATHFKEDADVAAWLATLQGDKVPVEHDEQAPAPGIEPDREPRA